MRKLFALALMALALASFVVGCGKKAEETTPAATETSTMSNDSTAAMGGGMDSTSMADSTKAKH